MKKLLLILLACVAIATTSNGQATQVFPILGYKTLNRATGVYDTTLSYQRKLIAGSGVTISSGTGSDTISASGGGTPTLTAGYIGYGNVSNELTGTSSFQWIDADNSIQYNAGLFHIYSYTLDDYILSANESTHDYEFGAGGNRIVLSNAASYWGSSNSDIDLRPDGTATVWGSAIVTSANLPSQAVTSITAGTGLSGGTITTTGTISAYTSVIVFDTTTITGAITGGGDTIRSFTATGTNWYEIYGQIAATSSVSSGRTNVGYVDANGNTGFISLAFAAGNSGAAYSGTQGQSYYVNRFKPAAGTVYIYYQQLSGSGNTELSIRVNKLP